MTKQEIESSINTLEVLLIIFGVLVAVGVTGESVFGFRLWRRNIQLRDIQSAENRGQEREIERLKKESETIRLDTANAVARAADAEKEAAIANEARLKIEERLAFRRISPEAHRGFVAALKPYAGSTVKVTKLGEFEAGLFADDLISVLKDAGWNIQLMQIGTVSPPVYGLRCTVNSSASGKALGSIAEKLPTTEIRSRPELTGISGDVVVGLRPPP